MSAASRGRFRSACRVLLALLALAAGIVLAAGIALQYLVLPHIDRWRTPVETRIGHALGAPVQIGSIRVRSGGWHPAFELRDVRVLDAQQHTTLTLASVLATVSVRSLLSASPHLEQLLIDAPFLEVRRDTRSHILVAGLDFGGNGPEHAGDGAAADWLTRQDEVVVRNGSLRWIDEQRAAVPPLLLTGVEIVSRNGWQGHALSLDATPPAALGERFSLHGQFFGPVLANPGDWRRWSGQVDVDLPQANVRELGRHVTLPIELTDGAGSLRGRVELHTGQLDRAAIDIALRTIKLQLTRSVQPLALDQISAHVDAAQQGGQTQLRLKNLSFVTSDGLRWPASQLGLKWQGSNAEDGELTADRLDLSVLGAMAAGAPPGSSLEAWLAGLQPQGVVTDLDAQWQGPLAAPAHYRVRAALSGLTLNAQASARPDGLGRPGLSNARVQFDARDTGGQASIGIHNGAIDLPGVLVEQVIPLDELDAQLTWQIGRPRVSASSHLPPTFTVKASSVHFANADTQGDIKATWRTGMGTARRLPGALEFDGTLINALAARTANYLPLALPAAVRSYVGRAVKGGRATSVAIHVRGDLANFPFRADRPGSPGEFRIAAQLENLSLAYVPNEAAAWPAMSAAAAELLIDRNTLTLRNGRAHLAGAEWNDIQGSIADLTDHPRLQIRGVAHGPLDDMLRFVKATPITVWTGGALSDAAGSGAADLTLALAVPLDDPENTTVMGHLALAGNEIRLRPDFPMLAAARGQIDFTQDGFAIPAASVQVLGGELDFQGGAQYSGPGAAAPHFTGQGTATAAGLQQLPDWDSLAPVARALSGQTHYRWSLTLAGDQPVLDVSSDLVGLRIDLPQPLGKAAAAPLPLHLQTSMACSPQGEAVRSVLQLSVGGLLQARYLRESQGNTTRVVSGVLRLAEPGSAIDPVSSTALVMPHSGVKATVALASLQLDAWETAVQRLFAQPSAATPWARAAATASTHGGEYMPDAIEAQVGLVELRGQQLGQLEIEASRIGVAAQGWQIAKLSLVTTQARLDATGSWDPATAAASRPAGTAMSFKLVLADSGAFLDHLGRQHLLRGGKGAITGQLSWPGTPLSPKVATMEGSLKLDIAAGQFLKAGPGAGRLLGVLSLQSLPRRLMLDFRDVFGEGFAFDHIDGDVEVAEGVARSRNLRMRGPSAVVLMEGSADLGPETQDLRVVVVPEVNAGAASLAYAFINPALGLGTFVAQFLLRNPLMAASTREFHVTGAWTTPQVEVARHTLTEDRDSADAPHAAAAPAN